jgi:hypothetical protein
MNDFPFARRLSPESRTARVLSYPFVELGPLTSHVYSHYAIVNAAAKLSKNFSSFYTTAVPILGEHVSLDGSEVAQLLLDVQSLLKKWTADAQGNKKRGMDESDLSFEDEGVTHGEGGNQGGGPGRGASRRRTQSQKSGGAQGDDVVKGNSGGGTQGPQLAVVAVPSAPERVTHSSSSEGTSDDEGLVSWTGGSSAPTRSRAHAEPHTSPDPDPDHPRLDVRALPGETEQQWRERYRAWRTAVGSAEVSALRLKVAAMRGVDA